MGVGYNPKTVTDGLVLCLDAANQKSYPGTGTVWTDLSGLGNNGDLRNGATYDSADNGSIVFDGTNDYCKVLNSSSLEIAGNNITLEAVYKSDVLASAQHGAGLISKGSGQNDGQYELLLAVSESKNVGFFRCAGMGYYYPSAIPMDIGTTYSVTGVLSNGYMRVYINGVQDGSGVQLPNSMGNHGAPLALGSRQNSAGGGTSTHEGDIYSAKVYNRALSAAEVQQNFNALRGRYGI